MKQETITGSCDRKGLFKAKNPYTEVSKGERIPDMIMREAHGELFDKTHPELFCYTPSNELVTDVENVEVIGPVWQYKYETDPGTDYEWDGCLDNDPALYDPLCETRQVYITVPPTESNIQKTDMTDVPLSPIADYYKELGNRMMPEAQPLEGVKTVEEQPVKEVKKKLPKTNSVYNYDKWPEIFGLSESTIVDIMEAAQQYDEAQQGEKDSKSYSDWVKMYGGIHRESPSGIKTRSFLACIRWLISIGVICEKSLYAAQFATDAGGGKEMPQPPEHLNLTYEEWDKLPKKVQELYIMNCSDKRGALQINHFQPKYVSAAPSTHSSSEMVEIIPEPGLFEKIYGFNINDFDFTSPMLFSKSLAKKTGMSEDEVSALSETISMFLSGHSEIKTKHEK